MTAAYFAALVAAVGCAFVALLVRRFVIHLEWHMLEHMTVDEIERYDGVLTQANKRRLVELWLLVFGETLDLQ